MFSIQVRKLKYVSQFTLVVGLVGLVLYCLTNNSSTTIQNGMMYRVTGQRKNLSKSDMLHNTNISLFSKITRIRSPARKEKKATVSNTDSPFIDPVFHVNTSSKMTSGVRVDHTILFLEPPSWFQQWLLSSNISQCVKYTNCKQTVDRSYFKSSTAVVFNLPERRVDTSALRLNPDQIWVFFTLESPLHINSVYKTPHWHNVFNWSWTYHPSADIFHPYGVLVEKDIVPYRNYSNIFRKKTKFAAWVVSNCDAPSERNEYVNILKQFVDVDIFGTCGQTAPLNLEKFLSENYKFYLGFENSLCKNYMTEKFFHYYNHDVITVLRGHTNYSKYLPKDSFIDTANFSSISALAKFMKDLGENEDKYVSYLKVKDKYKVYEREFLFKDALCNLCEMVNNIEKNRKTYRDINKWLGPCFVAKDLVINSSGTFDVTG